MTVHLVGGIVNQIKSKALHSAYRRYGTEIAVTCARRADLGLTAPPAVLTAVHLLALGMRDLPAVQALLSEPLPEDDSPAPGPSRSLSPKRRALSQLLATAYVNDIVRVRGENPDQSRSTQFGWTKEAA